MTARVSASIAVLLTLSALGCCGGDSDVDKCIGVPLYSADLTACESACGDMSLEAWEQAEACYFLGSNYEAGTQVTKDEARAREYYDKACGLGSGTACTAAQQL